MVGEPNITPVKTVKPVATQPVPVTVVTATPTTPDTPITSEPKKSIFKTWWLWAIIAAIIIGGGSLYFIL